MICTTLALFLFIRLYELHKNKSLHLRSSAQELTVLSLFILSPLPRFLWVPFAFGLYIRWYGFFRYQADILTFIKSPRCFFDSFQTIPRKKPLCVGVFLSLLSCFLLPPPSVFWCLLLPFSLFASFYKPKRKSHLPKLSFPNEIATMLSPLYPALRKTDAFLGEKSFNVKLEKPNIIFIFLESFRAKNVGCLGAKIPVSPHFDKWAKQGILFRNFHANGLQTFRAFISAYFGIPAHLRTVSLKPFCSMSMIGLPQILKKNGYHNAIIQSGDLSFDHLYPFFKCHDFDTMIGGEELQGPRTSSWGIDDESMVRYAAKWLNQQNLPTFLSLFTITNHHPWKSPTGSFTNDPYQNFLQTFAYTDHCLNLFLERINLEKSIVFIAGDHGQEMGERRPYFETNHSLYEENIHLPLLILGQSIAPQTMDCNASFVDFLPTVLDMLQLKEVHHSVGKSLLRKVNMPTYFSMHREELQIGAILGQKKVIQDKGYHLEKDPDENNDIGPELRDLSIQCKEYFQEINALTEENAWAPPGGHFSLIATPSMNEESWISHVHQHPQVPVIDLSSGHLGDGAITNVDPGHWHQVCLRNCTRMTDRSLEWMSRHCKKLMTLDLSYCHLLTDEGVRKIFLPQLKHLFLDDLDIEDFVPPNIHLNLKTFSLKNIPRLQAKSLVSIYTNSPHLISWSASLSNVANQDIFVMSQFPKKSTNMFLSDGIHIQDDALSRLLASQPELLEIHIENFPLIEQPDFSKVTKLRYLTIIACPRLSTTAIESLKNLPIQFYVYPNKLKNRFLSLLG
ncbi:MAG TPA: sulfatase-like hydrolase/transferase [Chlamydiales bacterium]|nr:sulfatase-like hydrolase/transferase [Chlamydiales bacterium]